MTELKKESLNDLKSDLKKFRRQSRLLLQKINGYDNKYDNKCDHEITILDTFKSILNGKCYECHDDLDIYSSQCGSGCDNSLHCDDIMEHRFSECDCKNCSSFEYTNCKCKNCKDDNKVDSSNDSSDDSSNDSSDDNK